MPVAINTFVILGGLMNKDNVVATLKQNAIVRRNFTDVCIKKVNDLNYGLVDYVYLQDKKKGIGVRFPVEGVDSDISEEAFIDIVLQACISYAKSESKIRKCSDIRYAVKNHTLRIKLSYKGLEHTIDTCMIAGELLDLNVLIQSVISDNDDSMYRSFIPCNELERFGYDVESIVTTAIQDSVASGFSLKSLVDVLKEMEAPIDLRDKSSMYVLEPCLAVGGTTINYTECDSANITSITLEDCSITDAYLTAADWSVNATVTTDGTSSSDYGDNVSINYSYESSTGCSYTSLKVLLLNNVGEVLGYGIGFVNDVPAGENITGTMYAIAAPHSLDSLADMAMFSCPTLE